MRAHDDALLKLKVPSAALVTELFKPDSDGVISDNGAQAALVAGTLTPRNYVRRVIEATELWVVQAGKLWRDVGRVDTHSPLLAPKYPLAFDRSFLSARDAALNAHEQIGSRRSLYYGGYVLKGQTAVSWSRRPWKAWDIRFRPRCFSPRATKAR